MFTAWREGSVFEGINHAPVLADHERTGRAPSPSAPIIPGLNPGTSQSVKTTEAGGPRRYNASKKVKGRKRHALVDTDGRALVIEAHPVSVRDREARAGIGAWIEFYNERRPHQALGNRTPMQVRRDPERPMDMPLRLDDAGASPTWPQPQPQPQAA